MKRQGARAPSTPVAYLEGTFALRSAYPTRSAGPPSTAGRPRRVPVPRQASNLQALARGLQPLRDELFPHAFGQSGAESLHLFDPTQPGLADRPSRFPAGDGAHGEARQPGEQLSGYTQTGPDVGYGNDSRKKWAIATRFPGVAVALRVITA